MTILDDQVTRLRTIDPEYLLGSLFWVSIPSDLYVKHPVLTKMLSDAGMDGEFPNAPHDAQVFRRVTGNLEIKKMEYVDPATGNVDRNKFVNYLVRSLPSTKDEIVRRLVCEVVDPSGRKLNYTETFELVYNRQGSYVNGFDLVPGATDAMSAQICAQVKKDFAEQRDALDDNSIRSWIRLWMLGHGATAVRTGVFFVAQERSVDLGSLESFITSLPGAEFHSLPLVRDDKQSELIRKSFEAESKGALTALIAEIKALPEEIPESQYVDLINRTKAIGSKTREFNATLSTDFTEAASLVELCSDQLLSMGNRVAVGRQRARRSK